jgi:hypothetical protein
MFFDILLNDATMDAPMSYNQMAIEAKSKFGIEISKQAIADHFNEGALGYTQNLLGEYLSGQVCTAINTA